MDVKFAYYSTSKGYRVVGGTAAQFLKADGSVDNTLYIPANTEINMGDKNLNFTSGSLSKFENSSRVFNKVYQRFSIANQVGILSFKFPQASTSATMFDVTLKIYGWQNRILGNIRIGFYKITGAAVNGSHKAVIECSDNFPTNIINVGIDAAGMVCINIGEATTVWNTYLNVEVERVVSFHSGGNFDWSKGWSQTIETDVSSYVSIATVATEVVASRSWTDANNIGSIPKAPTALGGNSLNTITTPGFYAQNSNSNATDGNSYPTNFAGFLVVNRTTGVGLVQAYTDYTNAVTWKRIFNGTSWGNWRKLWSELDFTSASINTWNNSASQASLLNYYTKNEALNLFVGKSGVETIADTKTFTHSPVIPNGTLGTHAVNKNQIELSATPESEGGQQLNISGNNSVNLTNYFVTSRDGSRNPDDIAPNSTPKRVRFDFANSTSAGLGATGNYAGIMTFAPWDGTSASTGDSSYQLAFANQSGVNGAGVPMLKIRKGIDGKWGKAWYKFWTDADFNNTNIQQWNYAYQYGLKLNEEFTTNSNRGLMLADNYFGGESGMVDIQQQAFVAGKTDEYYKYGSGIYGGLEGVNYHLKSKNIGIGGEADPENKVRVEGCVKATENFKSKEEQADTLFIPNGKLATLRDEIVNDESDYAIRLDPHEYEFDPSGYLEVDDRNRLIHIIGEQTKMVVNFREIYPKQQIVIYNFDKSGNSMAVQIYGKTIYNIESGFFLRLYITKSRRVIAERQQPSDFIW